MSPRTLLLVALALIFGLATAFGVNAALRGARQAPGEVETVPVVVAAADVPRYHAVSPIHLTTRAWPREHVPPGALTSIEEATGRVALAPLVVGEVVLTTKLASRDAGRGMAPGIEKGKRAFTIQTPNVAAGVAGFVLPGDKVDVLLTVGGNGGDNAAVTLTLLQYVEILAVDQRVEAPSDNKVDTKEMRSVTLLVTPEDMVKLDLGQNKGTLHLALRNRLDTEYVPPARATLQSIGLLPPDPRPAVKVEVKPALVARPAEPPQPLVIRTVRGTQEGGVLVYPTGR